MKHKDSLAFVANLKGWSLQTHIEGILHNSGMIYLDNPWLKIFNSEVFDGMLTKVVSLNRVIDEAIRES